MAHQLHWADVATLLNNAPMLVWAGDPDGRCIFLNETWTKLTGQAFEDGLGWGFLEAIHPDDRMVVQEAWKTATQSHSPYTAEYRLAIVDSGYTWMLDTAAPHFSREGDFLGYIGCIANNAGRRKAEDARLASQKRLDIAVHAAGLGVWDWDLQTDQFLFSDTAREIFGFKGEDTISLEAMRAVMHPDDLPLVQAQSASALDPDRRATEPYRYRIVRTDGQVRWILAHGEAIFEQVDGTVKAVSFIGTFQDVTEQTDNERRILDSEERLRLALESGGIAVWELNLATGSVTHSPELNRLYGFPPEAVPTVSELQSRYAPGERERLAELSQQTTAQGETTLITEVRHIMPDGEEKWLFIRAQSAVPNSNGEARVVGVVMDVTERRAAEERLKIVARELQHRVKNSVAVIQTLAAQTFRSKADPEALETFNGRLRTLAATTDILTRTNWDNVAVSDVFAKVLAPYISEQSNRITVLGPKVDVPSKVATALAMAGHELATNAVKYGALSNEEGFVRLNWTFNQDTLFITWTEAEGPVVEKSPVPGFGTKLLRQGLLTGRDGLIRLNFNSSGLVAEIEVNMKSGIRSNSTAWAKPA